jgi:Putative transposase, YhgA-like
MRDSSGAGGFIDTGRMSTQIGNVHDAFFKRVMGEPSLARTFLREHLPAEVAELLGPEPPEPVAGSFVDEELREHHSDLLFRVQLKEGSEAFTYVLMEHKSTPDRGARLQLLRYVVRVLTDWYERNGRRLPLPPVLPLLANQGPEGWTFSTEFVDLFGAVPEPLRQYLPSFRHALVDLAKVDDERLSEDLRLRAFLATLKYGRRSDVNEHLGVILVRRPDAKDDDLCLKLTYLDQVAVLINSDAVNEALSWLSPQRKEKTVGYLTQSFYDKGRTEGETRGEARMLIRFLENRFGGVPDSVRRRIFSATASEIDSWGNRVCHATDLQSIFDSN